jgi:hypothetical protein
MSTFAHITGPLVMPAEQANTKADAPSVKEVQPKPPVGYRWVARRWRLRPDGTRDYAAFHGKTAFSVLLPLSGRLKSAKR